MSPPPARLTDLVRQWRELAKDSFGSSKRITLEMCADDLEAALAADHAQGIIRIVFGKPIAWLGLASRDARALAAALIEKADELDQRTS